MLLTTKVNIKFNSKNAKHYYNLGYKLDENKYFLNVPISNVTKGSKVIIECKCDFCNKTLKIEYKNYIKRTIDNTKLFSCSNKCSRIKINKQNTFLDLNEYKNKLNKSNEKRKKTNLEKYGVEHISQSKLIKEKIKSNNLEKYDVEHISQSELIKDKIKNTNLEKYGTKNVFSSKEIKDKIKKTNFGKLGVEYPTQSKLIKEKIKKTNLEKYGVEHVSQSKVIKDKIKNTNLEKYGVEHFCKSNGYKNTIKNKSNINLNIKLDVHKCNLHGTYYANFKNINIKCNTCNKITKWSSNTFYTFLRNDVNPCYTCGNHSDTKDTIPHNKIKELLLNNNVKFIENYKFDSKYNSRKEIDLYIPSLNLGLEINGIYWHTEKFKINKNYHIDKTNLAKENNITLIHLWEDDINNKFLIVESMLLNKLNLTNNKIYARKCTIKEVSSKDCAKFLNENHLQGSINSKYKFGLYYNNELVSLITFGKSRFKSNQIELHRFCNKLNTNVIGGFSKLLNYFKNLNITNSIITYANLDHSTGNVYSTNGFTKVSQTSPNYFWVKDGIRYNRFKFRKSELIKQGYDSSKTEVQIMHELGYYRIYDCGNLKYLK